MTYGLETYDEAGNVIIESPTAVYDFYAGSETLSSSQTTISSTGYSDVAGILTRSSQYGQIAYVKGTFDFFYDTSDWFYINAQGVVSNGVYYPPSKHTTHTTQQYNSLDYPRMVNNAKVYQQDSIVYKFGVLSDGSSGFGLEVLNSAGQTVLSSEAVPIFIQPKTDNTFKRTVSCRSYGLDDSVNVIKNSRYASYAYSFAEKASNLVFDKAYDKPPLIFVVDSQSIPVAIWGYETDVDGKYIGATITSSALPYGTVPTRFPYTYIPESSAWRFGTDQTVDIEVVLVSDEYPDYLTPPSYGMQVYNSAGNVTFDSRLSPVAFSVDNRNIPYWRARQVGTSFFRSAQYYKDHLDYNSYTKSGLDTAVCLNSFQAATGYLCDLVTRNGGDELWNFNLYGRYVGVSKNGTDTNIDIVAGGTGFAGVQLGGNYREYTLVQYNGSGYPIVSVDAHRGQTTTFDVLTMSW
jgi:hypothetical protein